MKSIYKILENKINNALEKCHYEVDNVVVNEGNLKELGDYQFNGIMR